MTEPCDDLHAYVDGELDADQTVAFEAHLVTCDACNDELPQLLALMTALDAAAAHADPAGVRPATLPVGTQQLTVLPGGLEAAAASRAGARRATAELAPPRAAKRRPLWIAAGLAGLAAAAILLVVFLRPHPAPVVATLARDLGPRRTIEARLSYAGADQYRELDVARGARGHEDISLARMAELEAAKDWHGIGVAALLNGEVERAGRWLAQAPSSPTVDSDRAALELLDGSPDALERALTDVDRALASAPKHGPARWNRALVLAALHLPLAAARDFDLVVAAGERGWADEARRHATALRAEVAQRRTRWKRALEAGERLIADGTPIPADLMAVTGYMTITLYDAVRAAPSRQRVEALLPLAEALDREYASDRLASYVRRIAASDFAVRKPLTEVYRQLALKQPVAEAALTAFLQRLEQTHTDDLRLGAMVWTSQIRDHLDDYRRLAAASQDPWFALIADHEAAKASLAHGDPNAAERQLGDALALARRERVGYRALQLERELVGLHFQMANLAKANSEAQAAYREAIAMGDVLVEMNLLSRLAAINQDRYAYGQTRAYLAELLERSDSSTVVGPSPFDDNHDCAARLYAYDSLANLSLLLFDADRARAELDRAPTCEIDVATHNALAARTALVRTELARFTQREDDRRRAREAQAALRAAPALSDAQRAELSYLEGGLLIDVDRAAGAKALRDAIVQASRPSADQDAMGKVRAYGMSALVLDAGRAAEFGRVIDLMAETLGVARPAACTLAIAVQSQQAVVAFADARGETGGQFTAARSNPSFDASGLVPAATVDRLRSCAQVAVLARAPVLGSGHLLPPDVAWSYRLAGRNGLGGLEGSSDLATPPREATGKRLVVANPALPSELKMPPLGPYPDEPDATDVVVLRGVEATPARVSLAMRAAAVIEFHTHGFIANDVSEASYLMLSPGPDQHYALTARDVSQVQLSAAPLVILGACHAAASSRSLEGGMGLAEAFLRAGARSVVASPDAVQDLGAHAFFTAVRERVVHGAPPAIAVRDERMQRLAISHDDTWVSGVIVFE